VYIRSGPQPFKVISHAEQLALSACSRGSAGKLWCGTCHDPHPAAPQTSRTYNARCETCHQKPLAKSHPTETNCIACPMTRQPAQDGGHTVFTDHRIRKPGDADEPGEGPGDLRAWREPAPRLQARNLALAYVNAGIADHSPSEIAR